MAIYLILLGLILIPGRWMPQTGPERKYYIALMGLVHLLLCGLRHPHLTGDLMKYHWEFLNAGAAAWVPEGKNPGFFLLMKAVFHLSNGNFQIFLLVIAAFVELAVGLVVYRCSPAPWLSYLVWNCLGFYLFGFSAIKQALGMALVMLAFLGMYEEKPKRFLVLVLLAGSVHLPMLSFLPACFLTRFRVERGMLCAYALLAAVLYLLRQPVVDLVKGLYYGGERVFSWQGGPGGRFFLILLIAAAGGLLRGWEDRGFCRLFHFMAVSAILQLFSGFDNVFTRLADVYFQFSILFIPQMLCLPGKGPLACNRPSRRILAGVAAVCLMAVYWKTNLDVEIASSVDDYLNFRFFWQER